MAWGQRFALAYLSACPILVWSWIISSCKLKHCITEIDSYSHKSQQNVCRFSSPQICHQKKDPSSGASARLGISFFWLFTLSLSKGFFRHAQNQNPDTIGALKKSVTEKMLLEEGVPRHDSSTRSFDVASLLEVDVCRLQTLMQT